MNTLRIAYDAGRAAYQKTARFDDAMKVCPYADYDHVCAFAQGATDEWEENDKY